MSRIFISYRRSDTISATGRLHDFLVNAFGTENIFKDVEDIPPGVDFRQHLKNSLDQCDVVLVMIGNQWISVTDAEGKPRLFNDDDWVRNEVAIALSNSHTLTIPILVEGAPPPQSHQLPDNIKDLAYRNAFQLRNDPDFVPDARKLIAYLREKLNVPEPAPAPAPAFTSAVSVSTGVTPSRTLPLIVGVLAVIALIALGLLLLPGLLNPVSPTPAPLTDAIDVPVIEDLDLDLVYEGETTLFRDELVGLSFEHPVGWTVVSDAETLPRVFSDDIEILVYQFFDLAGDDLNDMVEAMVELLPEAALVGQEQIILGDDAVALFSLRGDGDNDLQLRGMAAIEQEIGYVFTVGPLDTDNPPTQDEIDAVFNLLLVSIDFD